MDKYDVAIAQITVHKNAFALGPNPQKEAPIIGTVFCDIALEAIREKQDRENGCCECKPMCCTCKHEDIDMCPLEGKSCVNYSRYEPNTNYCSSCGRKLV
jgi:hypothetical protein